MRTTPTTSLLAALVSADGTSGWKAEQALLRVAELPADDLAKKELLAAAAVFALLEVARAIEEGPG